MLIISAQSVREGDNITIDEGLTWQKVTMKRIVDVGEYKAVLFTTDDCQKIWLWGTEDVAVRI